MFETLQTPTRIRLTRPRLAILLTGTAAAMPDWLRGLETQQLAEGMRPAEGGFGVLLLPEDRPAPREDMPEALPFPLRRLQPEGAPAGWRWREGMRHAADWVGPEGGVLLADAAARPQPGWLAAHAAGLAAGAEVVAGRLRPVGSRDAARDHAGVLARIAARLDPRDEMSWPGLDAEIAGNISLRAALLRGVEAADGPPALLAGLRRRDTRISRATEAMVAGPGAAPRLERLGAFRRRMQAKAALRWLWEDGIGTALPESAALRRLAGRLGMPAGALAALLRARHFGAAWAAVEEASPRLGFEPMPPEALASEHLRARLLLAWLSLKPRGPEACESLDGGA